MSDDSRGTCMRFILIVSSFYLVFLRATSAERNAEDILSNYEIFGKSGVQKSSGNIEFPVEVIGRAVDSARESDRKKREAEETKTSSKSSLIPSAVASKSTRSDSNKINERAKASEKTIGKRSEALENEEEEEEDDEDEDNNEEISHQYRKRGGSREPKIWDQWGKWSCCSASCGAGKITRWRHCMAGGCASGEKEAQLKACQIKSC